MEEVRILTLLDEYTRECLAIRVDRRITSQEVIEQLFYLLVFRGIPDVHSHLITVLNSLPRQYASC